MTGLRRAAEDYLAMRRALGFKLTTQAAQLMSFVDYCESRGSDRITSELALQWATTTRSGSSHDGYLARRLMTVRIFARHYQTLDPDSEIPPEDALPHHRCRIAPHLYSTGEISALIDAAGRLRPPLRAATWQTLIGLLTVTGMRKSEACRLDDEHVDLDAATLVVLDSKFGKSRRLFLHPSTVAALRSYRQHRDRWCPHRSAPSFFVCTRGTRLDVHNLSSTFAGLVDLAGITVAPRRRRPRLHDLRHGFAVATLADFYRDGGDVQAAVAGAVDLARTRRPEVDLLVPAVRPGTAHPGRRAGSRPRSGSPHDRARADPAGVLHRQADPTTPRRPEHPRRLPRHLPTAAQFASRTTGNRTQRPRPRPDRRRAGHRLSDPPGNRPRQHRRHPQRPPGRDPLPVPLRGAARTRTRRAHQPSTGDPTETLRPSPWCAS